MVTLAKAKPALASATLAELGSPLLLSASNKTFLGVLFDEEVTDRRESSLAAAGLGLVYRRQAVLRREGGRAVAGLAELLAVPAAARTAEQRELIRRYYLEAVDQPSRTLRAELAEAARQSKDASQAAKPKIVRQAVAVADAKTNGASGSTGKSGGGKSGVPSADHGGCTGK